MFSGIVQQKCVVKDLVRSEGLLRFTGELGTLAIDVRIGASIAIGGVCLTVVEKTNETATFEVIQETLVKTTLGQLREGDWVNVERSVRVGDEIGGHRVSGHVTGMATIRSIETPVNNHIVTLACDPAWIEYLLPKGFVALDGCSLTIVDVGADWFTIHLIPETLRVTTFGQKTVGDRVNLELDPETQAIVATVKRYLASK
jgi:riboflavin synthase